MLFNMFNKKNIIKVSIEDLFNSRVYQPYVKNEKNENIRKFFWDCNDIQESLNKIVLECEKLNTPESRYYKALSLAWSRVDYNDRAIEALRYYLENEPYIIMGNKTDILRASTLGYLGKAYEKKYEYDTALFFYEKQSKLDESQIPLINRAEIYRKKNDLDSSIKLMENASNNPNSEVDKAVVKRYLEDYQNKKKNGYIFRTKRK